MLVKVPELLNHMESKLDEVKTTVTDPEEFAHEALEVVIFHLDEVNKLERNYTFKSVNDEVQFYKHYKPKLISKYLYFYRLAKYEIQRNSLDSKGLMKYFKKEKKRILSFFERHVDLVATCRSTDPVIDEFFFSKKSCCQTSSGEKVFLMLSNPKKSKNDLILAEIMANEMLFIYIEKELVKLRPVSTSLSKNEPRLQWTGSKVAIVELVYAMLSMKVINHGEVDIKDLVRFFEHVFHFKIDSPYQVFSEIKGRKQDQTKFLDQLKEALLQRIAEE